MFARNKRARLSMTQIAIYQLQMISLNNKLHKENYYYLTNDLNWCCITNWNMQPASEVELKSQIEKIFFLFVMKYTNANDLLNRFICLCFSSLFNQPVFYLFIVVRQIMRQIKHTHIVVLQTHMFLSVHSVRLRIESWIDRKVSNKIVNFGKIHSASDFTKIWKFLHFDENYFDIVADTFTEITFCFKPTQMSKEKKHRKYTHT